MISSSTLTVLGIHGLPTVNASPTSHLQTIEETVSHIAVAGVNVRYEPVLWSGNSRREKLEVYRHVEAQDFVPTYLGTVASAITSHTRADHDVVLIAYSAGGLLTYQFLQQRATIEDIKHIRLIITLAAPQRCQSGSVALFRDDETFIATLPFGGLNLKSKDIVAKLRRRQLVAILAENDRTVLWDDGAFPPELVKGGKVAQVTIPATHNSICHHALTQQIIARELQKLR